MPSAKQGGRGRSAIPFWRVKCGKREVYLSTVGKKDASEWIRKNQSAYDQKLKLVPPNS